MDSSSQHLLRGVYRVEIPVRNLTKHGRAHRAAFVVTVHVQLLRPSVREHVQLDVDDHRDISVHRLR